MQDRLTLDEASHERTRYIAVTADRQNFSSADMSMYAVSVVKRLSKAPPQKIAPGPRAKDRHVQQHLEEKSPSRLMQCDRKHCHLLLGEKAA